MGPNGSGKSTLSNVIMGRPGYVVTSGEVIFKGEKITGLTTDQRAKRGLFLALQYPTEVPGVSVVNFLRTAYQAVKGEEISALAFRKHMKEQMDRLGIEDAMVQRYVNQGFSGGEKKRNEILQLAVLAAGDRDPRRDRLRSRHRLAEAGRGRRGGAGRARPRRPADHPLPADPQLHHRRPRPRDDAGSYREVRRPRARERARGEGVRGHPRGARHRGRGGGEGDERRTGWRRDGSGRRADPPGLPDPRARRSTGTRSSTWTPPPRRRSPGRSSTPSPTSTRNHNANAHRGIYTLGEESTEAFEGARAKLASLLRRPGSRARSCSPAGPPSR